MIAPRVIKLAPGEDGQAWADALSDPAWRESAELLKRDGGVSVWRTELLGRDVVVKCWSLARFKRRLQALAKATPGLRQWRGATWLQEHEIPTADPFVIVRTMFDGQLTECLVMRALFGASALEHMSFGDLTARQELGLARALGDQIRAMIDLNRCNRDYKPSNLIVSFDKQNSIHVSMIDTVAIRRSSLTWDDLCDMLADLVIEPTGCGCPPRKSLMLRTALSAIGIDDVTRREHWAAVKKEVRDAWLYVEEEIEDRGNLTPKVNPLQSVRRTDG